MRAERAWARAKRALGARWVRSARDLVRGNVYRSRHWGEKWWRCPICRYHGPFADVRRPSSSRRFAACPSCGALERHRLQSLAMREVLRDADAARLAFVHFAPEGYFRQEWRRRFGTYLTADLDRDDVALHADLCRLPFRDESLDVVYASHVLEHIRDDAHAIAEIWRVLRPGGMAVLPVPLVGRTTVEYGEANPHEWGHWRAPAPDYFDRYRERFREVREYASAMFPEEHQLYVYEDMTKWPTAEHPLRQRVEGDRHQDIVPVCVK
jgi:predicted SAM-dependent methyltransferase